MTLALALLVAGGCEDGKKPSATTGSTTVSTPTTEAPGDLRVVEGIKVEASLYSALREASETCQITGAGARPRGCDELDGIIMKLIEQHQVKALGTLAALLTHDSPKTRHIAAWYILASVPSRMRHELEKAPETIEAPVTAQLLRALAANDTREAGGHLYAATAIHLATLRGEDAQAVKVVEQLKGPRVKANATQALMRYARLKTFPTIKQLAASADPPSPDGKATRQLVRQAAYRAPLAMSAWTQPERDALCPWFVQALGDEQAAVAAASAQAMLMCGGPFIDKLLDEAERRATDTSQVKGARNPLWPSGFAFQLRETCAGKLYGTDQRASTEQCARLRKFFEGLVTNNAQPARIRAFAVASVSYAWREPATLPFLKKYAGHPVPEVANTAKRHYEVLTNVLVKEGKLPPSAAIKREPPRTPKAPPRKPGAPTPANKNPGKP